MNALYNAVLPWFLHRPILLEMFTCLTLLSLTLAIIVANKDVDDVHYNTKVGAIAFAILAYLLIPENIRLLPLQFHSPSDFAKRAQQLPRISKSWEEATKPCGSATNELYVVIGGSGFVGHRIVHALYLRGERRIRVVDIDQRVLDQMKPMYPDETIEFIVANVTDKDSVSRVVQGANCVYAPVAVIRYWEVYQKHWPRSFKVNVEGTKNIVYACQNAGVSRVIITSSSAAIEAWPGFEPSGVDESTPIVTKENYLANYMLSKSLLEQIALAANGINGMAVSCIRPCSSVWGYGDKLALGIGMKTGNYPCLSCSNAIDYVHVDVVVLAHLLLEAKLRNGCKDAAAGEAFCISNGEALAEGVFAKLLEQTAQDNGIKLRAVFLPSRIVWLLSFLISAFDYVYPGDTCSLLGRDLGMLTFPTLLNASHSLVVRSMEKSKRVFGFEPHMSVAAAAERTMQEYRTQTLLM